MKGGIIMAASVKMIEFSKRASWIRKMFEQGALLKSQFGAENVCDFSLGNPDLMPPHEFQQVVAEISSQEGPGVHSYMPNSGYPFVRDAVAATVAREQGAAVTGGDILMTCGAAGALNVILKALLNPGDEVIMLAPYFVEYNFYIDNQGGVGKVVSTTDDFDLDLEAIEQALSPRTKALIINSPNNPTGQIYAAEKLAALGELLTGYGHKHNTTIYLISDEPYRKIIYSGFSVPSVLNQYQNSIIVNSYSKDLSLPGERIGYLAVHPDLTDKVDILGAATLANRILGFVNAPAFMQRVIARLQDVTVDCSVYERRRDLFCAILKDAGYEFLPPKGAFYVFPKSPLADDAQFVAVLLKQRILAVPGRGFGTPGYFRLAFCVGDEVIQRSAEGFHKAMDEVRS